MILRAAATVLLVWAVAAVTYPALSRAHADR
ncbi:hypothetical protein QE418_000593 [Microbacterium testaceum]|nr:hypothetical protein [Microbacterium testaceum]MDR6098316.1 hypothetical protein [Microbacterium sp. SORGH_AS_0454]